MLTLKAQQKGVELSLYLDPILPGTLIADAERLKQVLRDLLDNAIKFTHEGHVTLRVQQAGKNTANHIPVHFAIEDTGLVSLKTGTPTLHPV